MATKRQRSDAMGEEIGDQSRAGADRLKACVDASGATVFVACATADTTALDLFPAPASEPPRCQTLQCASASFGTQSSGFATKRAGSTASALLLPGRELFHVPTRGEFSLEERVRAARMMRANADTRASLLQRMPPEMMAEILIQYACGVSSLQFRRSILGLAGDDGAPSVSGRLPLPTSLFHLVCSFLSTPRKMSLCSVSRGARAAVAHPDSWAGASFDFPDDPRRFLSVALACPRAYLAAQHMRVRDSMVVAGPSPDICRLFRAASVQLSRARSAGVCVPALRSLSLVDGVVDLSALSKLFASSLTHLHLLNCRPDPASVADLRSLRALRSLEFSMGDCHGNREVFIPPTCETVRLRAVRTYSSATLFAGENGTASALQSVRVAPGVRGSLRLAAGALFAHLAVVELNDFITNTLSPTVADALFRYSSSTIASNAPYVPVAFRQLEFASSTAMHRHHLMNVFASPRLRVAHLRSVIGHDTGMGEQALLHLSDDNLFPALRVVSLDKLDAPLIVSNDVHPDGKCDWEGIRVGADLAAVVTRYGPPCMLLAGLRLRGESSDRKLTKPPRWSASPSPSPTVGGLGVTTAPAATFSVEALTVHLASAAALLRRGCDLYIGWVYDEDARDAPSKRPLTVVFPPKRRDYSFEQLAHIFVICSSQQCNVFSVHEYQPTAIGTALTCDGSPKATSVLQVNGCCRAKKARLKRNDSRCPLFFHNLRQRFLSASSRTHSH